MDIRYKNCSKVLWEIIEKLKIKNKKNKKKV